jgi:hypothetical protein
MVCPLQLAPRPWRVWARNGLHHGLLLLGLTASLGLAGCEMLGIESPEKQAANRESEGRAIGSACRHAGRAIEDCYVLNRKADKSAIFAGWKEMNDYMRENNITEVKPVVPPPAPKPPPKPKPKPEDEEAEAEAEAPKNGKDAAKDGKDAAKNGSKAPGKEAGH